MCHQPGKAAITVTLAPQVTVPAHVAGLYRALMALRQVFRLEEQAMTCLKALWRLYHWHWEFARTSLARRLRYRSHCKNSIVFRPG
jgi:hypothetical protein